MTGHKEVITRTSEEKNDLIQIKCSNDIFKLTNQLCFIFRELDNMSQKIVFITYFVRAITQGKSDPSAPCS